MALQSLKVSREEESAASTRLRVVAEAADEAVDILEDAAMGVAMVVMADAMADATPGVELSVRLSMVSMYLIQLEVSQLMSGKALDPMVAVLMSRSVARQWQDAVVLVMDVAAEKVEDEESGLISQQFSQNQMKPSKIRMKTTVHVVPSAVVAMGMALVAVPTGTAVDYLGRWRQQCFCLYC
jgi:hypothetical protein